MKLKQRSNMNNQLLTKTENQIQKIKKLFVEQIEDFHNDLGLQSELEDKAESFYEALNELLANPQFLKDNEKLNILEDLANDDDLFRVKLSIQDYLHNYIDRFKGSRKVITEGNNSELCLCYQSDLEMWFNGLIDDEEFDDLIIERIVPSHLLYHNPYRFAKSLIKKYWDLSENFHKKAEDLINDKDLSLFDAVNKVCQ